ncbi:hypothetical protein HU200_029216 [Digitaria exilis]|uniref:Nodulin-like domain-containing protein n=1 Tax=Digitaria exilis TaxID=1010633 RepID=A0A835BUC3_9POAL|nr:hypothetical protein HU200_029216 [Digitaria exilis]CAB3489382.1 unnamed protein product [Digitaria exilis]
MVFASAGGAGAMAAELLNPRFIRQVVSGRWFTLFASLLILSSGGATYAFGIYSRDLRSAMGYDQRAIATLAFFKDLGANVGIPAGLLLEVAPPWLVLAAGAAMNLAGYLMVYLSVAGHVTRPPLWLMCFYICAGANSQTFSCTGALVTAVKNFPERSRGPLLGLLKGYVGISSAILAQLYLAIYGGDGDGGDTKSLVLLVAWLPAAASVVFLPTVRVMPPQQRSCRSQSSGHGGGGEVFVSLLYISMALAAYILAMIVVQRQVVFSRTGYAASAAGLLLILFLPLAVVVKQEYQTNKELQLQEPLLMAPTTVTIVDETASSPMPKSPAWSTRTFTPPQHGEDYTISQAVVSIDMAILFVVIAVGTGGTLTAIDNMGQIGQSLRYPTKTIDASVSLISVWNYAGRVAAGYLSESLVTSRRYKLPRPAMITAVLVVSCAGHLLIAAGAPRGTLYAASVIVGFCFGALWPLLFAVVSELFGLRRYSTLYNVSAAASPVGSYVLNVLVAGRLYDDEAARQHAGGGGGDKMCMGVECFGRSFMIIAAATAAGALVSMVLVWRTREFYRGDIYAKFRDTTATERKESPGV